MPHKGKEEILQPLHSALGSQSDASHSIKTAYGPKSLSPCDAILGFSLPEHGARQRKSALRGTGVRNKTTTSKCSQLDNVHHV